MGVVFSLFYNFSFLVIVLRVKELFVKIVEVCVNLLIDDRDVLRYVGLFGKEM